MLFRRSDIIYGIIDVRQPNGNSYNSFCSRRRAVIDRQLILWRSAAEVTGMQVIADQVWLGILHTDRAIRYCSALSDKFRRKHRWFTFFIAIAAPIAAGAVLYELPNWLPAVILLASTVVATWAYIADYSGKAATAAAASSQLKDLLIEWRELWYSGNITSDRIVILQLKYARIDGGLSLDEDSDLNTRVQDDSDRVIEQEFNISRS